VNRRDFLRTAASISTTAALGSALSAATVSPQATAQSETSAAGASPSLPAPHTSGIEHIVVVMQENRSFDHMLGWLPNANGRQSGLTYTDSSGEPHNPARLNFFAGCSYADPDHSYAGGRSEYNEGKMDGWLRTGSNDSFCIGYYAEQDLPLFSTLARNFTTLDNYFASILSSTFPNRVFQHAAQSDRLSNTLDLSSLPTIWDRLQASRKCALAAR
jgi:phospholipase C